MYLRAFAYGTVQKDEDEPNLAKINPTILTTEESFEALLNRAATVCRKFLEKQALEKGFVEQGDKYRVSVWVPAKTKEDAFRGFVGAYWFGDGTIGDTVTHKKHKPETCRIEGANIDSRSYVRKNTKPERCPVCGGLNPGDITHTRCQ